MRQIVFAVALLLTGCVTQVAPPRDAVVEAPPAVYAPPPPPAVVSVYVEPPLSQPEPIAIGWAPPPMLVESPPPPPFESAVWVGGYWNWHRSNWYWLSGRWAARPRPGAVWAPGRWDHHPNGHVWISGRWH